MTEYLILSMNRALPLIWEYNREITFSVTFSRNFGSIPKSIFQRTTASGVSGPSFVIDSTSKRIFRAFGTPTEPPAISGIKSYSKPRLNRIIFSFDRVGNPQVRFDLHYANSDGTPGQYITSFSPTINDRHYYVDYGSPPTTGYELEWNKLYSIVVVPTSADSSNRLTAYSSTGSGDTLVMRRIGTSTNGGATWTTYNNYDWDSYYGGYVSVAYGYEYIADELAFPLARSSEAFRSYFNGWSSRTSLPSGFVRLSENINGVTNLTTGIEIPLTDAYVHAQTFYTTANISSFTQTDVASFRWRYDINPVTIDMFYASEAYLQAIDFLGASSSTSSVRLNDSYEQEFSGNGGTSITFNPPILWWKAQVLSGSVRLRTLVFE